MLKKIAVCMVLALAAPVRTEVKADMEAVQAMATAVAVDLLRWQW